MKGREKHDLWFQDNNDEADGGLIHLIVGIDLLEIRQDTLNEE